MAEWIKEMSFDRKVSYGLIITIILQVVYFTVFLTRLDARVSSIEEDRFTASDWKLIEQRIDFFIQSMWEIKWQLNDIENEIKNIWK